MDIHAPLDPHQFAHLRVSTLRRTAIIGPLHCRVCHREYGFGPMSKNNPYLCDRRRCRRLAGKLGWV